MVKIVRSVLGKVLVKDFDKPKSYCLVKTVASFSLLVVDCLIDLDRVHLFVIAFDSGKLVHANSLADARWFIVSDLRAINYVISYW